LAYRTKFTSAMLRFLVAEAFEQAREAKRGERAIEE
jgi:hypothetical protein